jgi:hypothetical protein
MNKKAIISAMLIIATIISSFSLTSCSITEVFDNQDDFPQIEEGKKIDLSVTNLNIEESFKPANENNGYVNSFSINVKINGYEEFSYFNGSVTFVWTYDILLDNSEGYVEKTFSRTVSLSAVGSGEYKETVDVDHCRSIKNIKCEKTFSGYAIKK